MIISPLLRIVVELSERPRSVIVFSAVLTHLYPVLKSLTESQGIGPSQYSGTFVLGVPPLIISTTSANATSFHSPPIPNLLLSACGPACAESPAGRHAQAGQVGPDACRAAFGAGEDFQAPEFACSAFAVCHLRAPLFFCEAVRLGFLGPGNSFFSCPVSCLVFSTKRSKSLLGAAASSFRRSVSYLAN